MSFYDDEAPDEVAVLRQQFAELQATVSSIQGDQRAASAVDPELNQKLLEAETPEQVVELVRNANRTFAEARFGAAELEGVDV